MEEKKLKKKSLEEGEREKKEEMKVQEPSHRPNKETCWNKSNSV